MSSTFIAINDVENQNLAMITNNNENNNENKNNNKVSICCSILKYLISFILFCMPLTMPIVQIAYGIYYYHKITNCHSFITIPIWLIISGITGILMILLVGILFFNIFQIIKKDEIDTPTTSQDKITCFLCSLLLYIILIFNTIWTICGSIMFWRDCIHSNPSGINTLMWVTLILTYVYIYMFNQNKKNDTDK